jgi:hypothetical protein
MALARTVVALLAPATSAGSLPEPIRATPIVGLVGRYRCASGERPDVELRETSDGALELLTEGRALALEAWDDDRWLVRDLAWDDALLSVERHHEGVALWHGDAQFVPLDAPPRPRVELPEPLRPNVGTYRSHNPWCPVFRIVARDDRLRLLFPSAPDGFEDEQPLIKLGDGAFRAGEDPMGPERLRFDTEVEGRSLRAWLSGWPYYRTG